MSERKLPCSACGSSEQCSCAMRAYAAGEMAAAKRALEREDEIRASGKYREAGGPMQGLSGPFPADPAAPVFKPGKPITPTEEQG